MRALALACAAAALAAAPSAAAARFALGLAPGARAAVVEARVTAAGGSHVTVDRRLRAVFVDARGGAALRRVHGAAYVERLRNVRSLAFTPNDPLAYRQWYLNVSNAFTFWPALPALQLTKVAVVDSGIDGKHPEFARRIAAAKSFVGGSPYVDRQGHGTFVAGEIAAATNNGQGIAGMAFPAQLVIAKVVKRDRSIPLEAEARAIRWAADAGAQVINLSLSGVRDPRNPAYDTYSPLEASAVSYAVGRGALVVAAAGNGDLAPRMPWDYAGWPAALPHVLGVSAYSRDGSVPPFSDRDDVYNDIAAPGDEIFSTFPRPMTSARSTCDDQGYSDCAPSEYRHAEGTSFAAPLVAAAAGVLLSAQPALTSDQVTSVLEHAAGDARKENGCQACAPGRDPLTGWGKLDVLQALMNATYSGVPPADHYESNDDAGAQAHRFYGQAPRTITATLDYWDDQIDVYSVHLRRGQRLQATLRGQAVARTKVLLWQPGTKRVEGLLVPRTRVRASVRIGASERIRSYTAAKDGWYYLEVKMQAPGAGSYTLSFAKTK